MVAWNQYADGNVVSAAVTMDPTRPVYDNSTNVLEVITNGVYRQTLIILIGSLLLILWLHRIRLHC